MAKIIDFPNVDKLKEEVKSLRKELVNLIFCHDNLIAHEAIRVETEYKEVNLNLTVKKLKEEKRLVESFIRRDEPVDFYYISKKVYSVFTKNKELLRNKLTVIGSLDKYERSRQVRVRKIELKGRWYKIDISIFLEEGWNI